MSRGRLNYGVTRSCDNSKKVLLGWGRAYLIGNELSQDLVECDIYLTSATTGGGMEFEPR